MARVVITIEDADLTGGQHIEVTVESTPALPIAKVTDPRHLAELEGDEDLDVDRATPAQVAARLAVGEIAGHSRAALIMVRPE